MAFWEELGKTITDKGKEATKKAKELTEVIQIKSQISAEKTKISEAYATIGKMYYDDNKDMPDEKYADAFSWVKESLDKLTAMEEELSQLEGSRVCAECGCKVAKEDSYCRRCGAPMAQSQNTDSEMTEQNPATEEIIEEAEDVAENPTSESETRITEETEA